VRREQTKGSVHFEDNSEFADARAMREERGGPMADSNVRKLIARLGKAAKLSFPVHARQLRHGCAYALW